MDTETERTLVRRCRHGQVAAFEPLVRHYERPALAIARGYLADDDDAADAVQDAFVRAYATLDRLREGSTFGPWLRAILRNLCLDRLRVRRATVPWESASVDAAVASPSVEVAAHRAELAAGVRAAIAALAPDHRAVLVLKELEDLTYAEIARTLDVPPGTVASRLHHARTALRGELARRGITGEDLLR